MMMSREEEEERQNLMSLENSLDGFAEDDLEHLLLEEEEDGDDDSGSTSEVVEAVSYNASYGLGSSRASSFREYNTQWHPKSYEHTGSLPASPYLRPSLSPPDTSTAPTYSKIQLSPRLNPHLYASPRSPSPVPDLNEASDWPLPSPASSSTSPLAISSSLPGSQAASPSPANSVGNAWIGASKTGQAWTSVPPTAPSMLSARFGCRRSRHGRRNGCHECLPRPSSNRYYSYRYGSSSFSW